MILPGILLTSLLASSWAISYHSLVQEQWEQFKLEHNKIYHNEDEEQYRMNIFMDNTHTILEHNKLYEMGASTYTMGMNQFGDLTHDELMRYSGVPYNSNDDDEEYTELLKEKSPTYLQVDTPLPNKLDWRLFGAVTRVKNQLPCGACYAFTAIGALEAQNYFKTKKLVELSAQNIVDCTYQRKKYDYINNGCAGGRVDVSFQYIIDNGGIDTAEYYPYIADRNKKCKFLKEFVGARMSSFKYVPPGNETELQKAVVMVGPISVMVDHKNMFFYSGGIFDDPTCSSTEYTHGLVVVGYGTYNNHEYWLAKNSWGVKWGEQGYIMMMRNKGNQCAIATAAVYPLL